MSDCASSGDLTLVVLFLGFLFGLMAYLIITNGNKNDE